MFRGVKKEFMEYASCVEVTEWKGQHLYVVEYTSGRQLKLTDFEIKALMKQDELRLTNMILEDGVFFEADEEYKKDINKHIKAELLGQAPIIDWQGNVVGIPEKEAYITAVSAKILKIEKADKLIITCKKLRPLEFNKRGHIVTKELIIIYESVVDSIFDSCNIEIMTDELSFSCKAQSINILDAVFKVISRGCESKIKDEIHKLYYSHIEINFNNFTDLDIYNKLKSLLDGHSKYEEVLYNSIEEPSISKVINRLSFINLTVSFISRVEIMSVVYDSLKNKKYDYSNLANDFSNKNLDIASEMLQKDREYKYLVLATEFVNKHLDIVLESLKIQKVYKAEFTRHIKSALRDLENTMNIRLYTGR